MGKAMPGLVFQLHKSTIMTNKILISRRSIQMLRALVSGIFLVAGTSHLLQTEKTIQRIGNANFKGIAYFFGEPGMAYHPIRNGNDRCRFFIPHRL